MVIGRAAKASQEKLKAKETATSRVYVGPPSGLSKVGKKWTAQFGTNERGARKESRVSFQAGSKVPSQKQKFPGVKKNFVYPGTIDGRLDKMKSKR